MGHPTIEEFCRAGDLRPGMLRRFQREFREVIQPLLAEREQLLIEVEQLRAENTSLKPSKAKKATPESVSA